MRKVSVFMSVTLDGIVQGLGRPDEDTRNGFGYGGWGLGYTDDVIRTEAGKRMARPGDMLFGRRTWQDFITAWSTQTDGNPFNTPERRHQVRRVDHPRRRRRLAAFDPARRRRDAGRGRSEGDTG